MSARTPRPAPASTAKRPTVADIPPKAPKDVQRFVVVAGAINVEVGTHISAAGVELPSIERLLYGDVIVGREEDPQIQVFLRTGSIVPEAEFKGQRLTLAQVARRTGGEIDAAAEAVASRPTSRGLDGGVTPGSLTVGDLDG